MVHGTEIVDQGLGFKIQGIGCRVEGVELWIKRSGVRVYGLG